MTTQTVAPNFVETVAKMGFPIMDIPGEAIRKLVAITFIGTSRVDPSYTFEAAVTEVMGAYAEAGDVQKAMQAAKAEKQKVTATALENALKPFVMAEALKIAESERPLTLTILFDYSRQQRDANDAPVLDSNGNQVTMPDFHLTAHWTKGAKAPKANGAVDGRGRKPGYYLFNGEKYSSMGKLAKEKFAYDSASKIPTRQYLEGKGLEIPTESKLDSAGEPFFAVSLKVTSGK